MSTRGAIVRITSKEGDPITFEGRYHHWDSYPEGLGQSLYEIRNSNRFNSDTGKMLAVLIDEHPAGWSTIVGCDFVVKPGYVEDHTKYEETRAQPKCFCHGDRSEEEWLVTEENASGSGCEYVYAFTPEGDKMYVLSSYCENGAKMIGAFGCGDPNATWKAIAVVELDDDAPNWDTLGE